MDEIVPLAPSAPGVYYDIDINVYHGGPAISKSGLDDMEKSPATYYDFHINPARPPRKEKPGQLEGQLAHCSTLEPLEFLKRYAVVPDDAPRTPTAAQLGAKNPSAESRAAMDWWEQFNADNAGKRAIKQAQYEAAMRQAESIFKLKAAAEMLAKGRPEVSAYWKDPINGELCRCRPDFVHDASASEVVLLDVKTYSDASPDEFARQTARKRYHVQDSFYTDGFAFASKQSVLGFVFLAVETEWPYAASCTMLDREAKEQGAMDYRRNLELYAHCRKTGVWPGYSDDIVTISMPKWAITKQ